jgi:hypothetical protein
MRFTTVFAAALSVAVASANWTNETYTTTEVVTSYTTYCPYPTTIVENDHTYTVTEPTTLTITDCPCTRTKTYTTVTSTVCPGDCHPTYAPPPVYPNTTTPTHGDYPPPVETPTYPSGNTSNPEPTPEVPEVPPSTGAAGSNKATLAAGALAALVGAAAYIL